MRAPFAWLGVGLIALTLAACGSAGNTPSSGSSLRSGSSAHAGAPVDAGTLADVTDAHENLAAPRSGDGDGDSAERTPFDGDDFHSMHFGHAADAADGRTIAAVVKRYYEALAREDDATVCSLLLEVVAESLPESGSGQLSSPSPSGARTCPAAVSKTLVQSHRALAAEAQTLRVVGVRVRRRRASAILRFAGRAARHILLYKEEGSWKIGTLADEDLG